MAACDDHAEEGGFARIVGADDADDPDPVKIEGAIVDAETVAELIGNH